MIRQVIRGVVAIAAIAILLETAIGQPAGGTDKVFVRDKTNGTVKAIEGVLKFGPAGLQITGADGKVLATVSPNDVVKVVPTDLPGVEMSSVRAQLALEEKKTKKDYETARAGYDDLLKKANSSKAPDKSRQYLAFKLAMTSTKIADESTDEEGWAAQADAAVKEWASFLSEFKTGWEVWPAAKTNARLLIELRKFDEVARLWSRLTKKDFELPADLRLEASLQEIDAQIRNGTYGPAAEAAEALLAATPPGVAKEKLAIYSQVAKAARDKFTSDSLNTFAREFEKKLETLPNLTVRGVGYGMLAEIFLAEKRPRDAMWNFLWVETVYNLDKDDVLKAMVRLGPLYKEAMEDDREKTYREKIRRLRAAF